MNKKILIIDDDVDLCTLLSNYLLRKGFETETAHTGAKGIAKFADKKFDAVICDYRLGDMDGKELIAALKEKVPSVKVLVITGYSDIKTAVEVIKLGAYDYITKPLIPDEVVSILNNLLQKPVESGATDSRTRSVDSSQEDGPISSDNDFFEGQSPAARALYAQVRIVAGTNYSIILYGESGTGKEVIARTIHNMSQRSDKPFVAMDCGTLSKELAGSELFGHVKGAFTDARTDRIGRFELAEGGTIFLDEIGNVPLRQQAKLLRVIESGEMERVGSSRSKHVDVRLISATNTNLQAACEVGQFREDLLFRLNTVEIHLPALRERREDVPALAMHFLSHHASRYRRQVKGLDASALQSLLQYSWPGNVRELEHTMERAVLMCLTEQIQPADLGLGMQRSPVQNLEELSLEGVESILIRKALQRYQGNVSQAAEALGLSRGALYRRMEKYGL
jgi:DNA-binding NtrC family response regulator